MIEYKFKASGDEDIKFNASTDESQTFDVDSRIDIGEIYQGKTLVTPAKDLQILATKGKTLTEDININPIPGIYKDITDVTAEAKDVKLGKKFVTGQGLIEGSYVYDFMGDDAELIDGDLWSEDIHLSDTNFPSWTPSTTAKAMQSAKTIKTIQVDMENYEYMLEWQWLVEIAHIDGATLKATPTKQGGVMFQTLARRPNGIPNIEADNFNYNYSTNLYTASNYAEFYNTSGVHTWVVSLSYGLYASITAASFSSGTADNPNVTIKTPVINARCNNTYFATARAKEIDSANTRIRMKGRLYRIKRDTSTLSQMFHKAVDVFNGNI